MHDGDLRTVPQCNLGAIIGQRGAADAFGTGPRLAGALVDGSNERGQ